MVSQKKLTANQNNAHQSTGPRSVEGKQQSRCNSRKHGLSIPTCSDPSTRSEVERLAALIAGESSDYERLELARTVAEAEFDLRRIRAACLLALEDSRPDGKLVGATIAPQNRRVQASDLTPNCRDMLLRLQALERLERYQGRALSRRRKAMRVLLTDAPRG
jgi:hypothetical protein